MLKYGDVVISAAGRDKLEFLAVTASDETYVYVCNGKDRPLDNPKRKNPRHIRTTGVCVAPEELRSNKRLRKALAIVKANFLNEGVCF